jgi:hypothetical protein
MIQELRKLADTVTVGKEPSPPKKKGKTTSQPQKDVQTTSAMMVTSSKQSKAPQAKKPQSCKHCGKFVIHTDGICDVYNVPSANMASSGIRDTPNMSVVFQNMDFGNDNDNTEYLFVNDFGNLDDLTLARFMRMVAEPIRTSPVYDVSDDDVAPVQAPNHMFLPPDDPPIAPDLLNIKNCTRQLELYNRVCMEIQDVDAQPLRYGRHQYPGAVRADRPGNRICYAYLKPGEQLRVRRGTPKSVLRERQINSMLRRMWFGYRYQAAMSFPAMNPKHMFIYSGMVYRI